jgi:hypothetical protein
MMMSSNDEQGRPLCIGDPVRLKDSDLDMRGDVWQFRTGQYVIVRWEDEWRSTHATTAIELDRSRARAAAEPPMPAPRRDF